MKQAPQIILFSLLICLLPGMALAEGTSAASIDERLDSVVGVQPLDPATAADATAGKATDEAQADELQQDTVTVDDSWSETLDGLAGDANARFASGICHFLNPPRYCVDYDGNQGGLCPPTCIAPGGSCGFCEKDSGSGICHCTY